MDRYTILRDSTRNTRGTVSPDDFGPDAKSESFSVRDLPAPEIEIADLKPRDVEDLAADPEVMDFAVVMPTILLAPVARSGGDAAAITPGDSWGVAAVGASASPATGKDVTVCILDTGIDASHPAFQGINLKKRDFRGEDQSAVNQPGWDGNGHGTHCAGTIFGRDVDGARIGIARGVTTALIGKVLDNNGSGTTEMLFNGLQWAVGEGVDVVSMSIGFDFPGLVERRVDAGYNARQAASDALVAYRSNLRLFDSLMGIVRARAAFNEGTVIVAASGNESDRNTKIRIGVSIPAAAEGIISVGALEQKNGRYDAAYFSNTMPVVSAPGVGIKSAKAGGGLREMDGTSMACPHVAGVAALWWEYLRSKDSKRKSSASDVVHRLAGSARSDVFASEFSKLDFGAGLVSAPSAPTA